ncbi:MAG: hypothetical protein DCC67_07795 [Planctomycetota bacterium]|nr:MAG: hypothetical protein DCC67_07795 [Planctomycetota bacterium]
MAKLRMTNADYVAIAVSPALVMGLVGSLVFFLIEVLYVGDYPLRLNYVFALFVFATVLIARIAIELGSELAAMYSIPLGLVTFLALQRFVEHPHSFSWLINLALLSVVWWCAHKLTWDSTLIDDNEDSSGEGLLGRVGIDESDDRGGDRPTAADNELLAGDAAAAARSWRQRLFGAKKGPHTPGIWVLYFSVAALPLFGIGQRWIPASDVGRRRYVFGLLAVYVAAALSLLVTTSFLGLRRYLRQRRVEMPAPMAVTWVSLGAALILLVMIAAALLPRPKAEYALARPPWQAGSPSDRSANRVSIGKEGTVDESVANRVTGDNRDDAPLGDDVGVDGQSSAPSEQGEKQSPSAEPPSIPQRQQEAERFSNQAELSTESSDQSTEDISGQRRGDPSPSSSEPRGASPQAGSEESAESSPRSSDSQQQSSEEHDAQPGQGDQPTEGDNAGDQKGGSSLREMFEHPQQAPQPPSIVRATVSSLTNLLKLILYALLALAILYLAWRYRAEIARACGEIIQQLRDFLARLFGRRDAPLAEGDGAPLAAALRRRTFAEFTDPFLTGRHQQLPPAELVRYTFEAFEAWASDHGCPRTAGQTPHELLRHAVPSRSAMYEPARLLVRLYSEAAYASQPVAREAAGGLRELWHVMSSTGRDRRAPTLQLD